MNGQEEQIRQKIDKLMDARYAVDAVRLRMQQLIDDVMTPEQRRIIADIREEFESEISAAQAHADLQEAEIKEMVRSFGRSVRCDRASIVYSPGRVSWDNESLNAIAQTEEFQWLSKFRKEGTPIVSIRAH